MCILYSRKKNDWKLPLVECRKCQLKVGGVKNRRRRRRKMNIIEKTCFIFDKKYFFSKNVTNKNTKERLDWNNMFLKFETYLREAYRIVLEYIYTYIYALKAWYFQLLKPYYIPIFSFTIPAYPDFRIEIN